MRQRRLSKKAEALATDLHGKTRKEAEAETRKDTEFHGKDRSRDTE